MDAVLGISGILLIIAAVICAIIFGILLIVKAARKKPKKRMLIALGSSAVGLILGIILIAVGYNMSINAETDPNSSAESTTGDSFTSITKYQYIKIKIGMTENQLEGLISKPTDSTDVIDDGENTEWTYMNNSSGIVYITLNDKTDKVIEKQETGLLSENSDTYTDKSGTHKNNSDSSYSDSSNSSDNLSLSTAKTADQLKSVAIKADSVNVQGAFIRDGIPVIQLKNNTEWDEKTAIQNFALNVSDLLKIEKGNPNFSSFAFIRNADFTDEKGNATNETAILAYFTKKNANSINYSGFRQNVDLDPYKFYDVSDGYFIHPAIYSKIRDSFNGLPSYKNSSDRKISDDFSKEISAGY